MVWQPFAIAVAFGLVVSAGLYFILLWPQVEPDDEALDAAEAAAAEDAGDAEEPAVEEPAVEEPAGEEPASSTDEPPPTGPDVTGS